MAKVILNDGTEVNLSPGEARAKVAAGEATFPPESTAKIYGNTYRTKVMAPELPEKKVKRKRRTKAEMEQARANED